MDGEGTGGRSGATWSLLALTAVVTALPVVSAVRSVLVAAGVLTAEVPDDLRAGIAGFGLIDSENDLRVAEGFAAVVSIPVALSCLIVLVGLACWKEWAREGALGVFGIVGAVLLVFSLSGVTQEPRGEGAVVGLLASLLVLGVAALALSPGVRNDFERRRLLRARRDRELAAAERREREAAEAERRAQHLASRRASGPPG